MTKDSIKKYSNNTNEYKIQEGDSVNNSKITKISDKCCWLDGNRKSWDTVNHIIKNNGKLKTVRNIDKPIDWSSKDIVIEYYNSFEKWGFYISGHCTSKAIYSIFEVKNNIVNIDNINYLPAPTGYGDKREVKDGVYFGWTLIRNSGWFGHEGTNTVNVFWTENTVNKSATISDIKKLQPNSDEIYCYPYGNDFRVDYSQSSRSGLSIDNICITDFKKFFTNIYLSTRWGKINQHTFISDELMSKIEYGNDFDENITSKLNEILNSSTYYIDDDDSYGEYTLRYLKIDKDGCQKFFDCIKSRLYELK